MARPNPRGVEGPRTHTIHTPSRRGRPRRCASTGDLTERAARMRTLARAFGVPVERRLAEVGIALHQFALGQHGPDRLSRAVSRSERAWHATADDQLGSQYAALFLSPSGVPLREAAYVNDSLCRRAVRVADVEGFYRMFGFPIADDDAAQPPDHVSVELDFLGWLLAKEAYAHAHGLSAQARANDFAVGVFLDQHLGRWVAALAHRIRERAPHTAYAELGAMLLTVVACESRLRGDRRSRTFRARSKQEARE